MNRLELTHCEALRRWLIESFHYFSHFALISGNVRMNPGGRPRVSTQTPQQIDQLLASTEVGEVWCVGRRIGSQLREAGIKTVLDLGRLPSAFMPWLLAKAAIEAPGC